MNSETVPAERQQKISIDTGYFGLISVTLLLGCNLSYLSPIEITTLIHKLGQTPTSAGFIVSLEMIAVAVTGLATASFLRGENAQILSRRATAGALILNAVCIATLPVWLFAVVRVLCGACCGVVYSACCFWCARNPKGVRAFGIALMTASVIGACAMVFLPSMTEDYGLRGFYSPLTVFTAIVLAFSFLVQGEREPKSLQVDNVAGRRVIRHARWILPVILIVIALANGSGTMLWSFSDQVAQVRGYSVSVITMVLTGALIAAIAGSLLAAVVGERFGIALPLGAGLVICAVTAALVVTSASPTWYGIGMCAFQLGGFFIIPYQIGAGSVYDPSGRTASVAGSVSLLAGAFAPLIGGAIFDLLSPNAVGWGTVLACAVAAGGGACLYRRNF